MTEYDSVKIKEQLGNPDDKGLFIKRNTEVVAIEESPTLIQRDTIGHSWICGSSSNGLVGTNTATYDGQQQVVGGANRVVTTVAVILPYGVFSEYFLNMDYLDTASTAVIDLTAHEVRF